MKAPTRTSLNLGLDLDNPQAMQTALAKCVALGTDEEFRNIPQHATGDQLVEWLGCSHWRMGCKRYLRSAYEAGRFSARMCVVGA